MNGYKEMALVVVLVAQHLAYSPWHRTTGAAEGSRAVREIWCGSVRSHASKYLADFIFVSKPFCSTGEMKSNLIWFLLVLPVSTSVRRVDLKDSLHDICQSEWYWTISNMADDARLLRTLLYDDCENGLLKTNRFTPNLQVKNFQSFQIYSLSPLISSKPYLTRIGFSILFIRIFTLLHFQEGKARDSLIFLQLVCFL